MKQRGARLGQHFLNNPHYAQALVNAAGVTPDDTVLEIGPGTGALTKSLLTSARHVVAIEKDETLAEKMRALFATEIANGKLTLVTSDVRNSNPVELGLIDGNYILAANIPYYITGEIIRQFLEIETQPKTIAILIQREVAQRIVSDTESILSISVKVFGTPKLVIKVSRGNFSPPPSVDSAILTISNISKRNFEGLDEKAFFEVLRSGFAAKRKLLANNLGVKYGKETALSALIEAGVPAKARAENVRLDKWLALSKILNSGN